MEECPCSNIAIMQLFHELKQKYPAVPDRVVTECIRLNVHDKEACETVLSKENQTYSFPGDRVCKMAAENNCEPSRPDSLQLEETLWDFDRRLMSHQSLDSLRCSRSRTCKRYSEEHRSDENLGAISRLSIHDERWSASGSGYRECSDECRTRVSVVSTHSAPATPMKVCTQLSVEPVPHYLPAEPSRPYTSVNLTLRPPSADPQPPIDISSAAGGLTYSSCSYDPRQGYQSRLQISIGPGGQGTVSAARTRMLVPPSLRPASSMPDVTTTSSQLMELPSLQNLPPATKALVQEQLERKERLSQELRKQKQRLRAMQDDVRSMNADLQARLSAPALSITAQRLRQEISQLQIECKRMTQEVFDNAEISHVNTETLPLGETSEEFYKNIYRGQLFPRQAVRHRASVAEVGSGEGRKWTCHVCTFHNHPLLNKCEQCDMPRITTGAETQNIHIHVTHHNVPSSPYRRVVHSWVV